MVCAGLGYYHDSTGRHPCKCQAAAAARYDYDSAPTDPAHGGKMTADMARERIAALERRVVELQSALRSLVMLERVQAPDMGSKSRTWAFMQTGAVLAEALDKARETLGKTV
jgi:hypothetical protein